MEIAAFVKDGVLKAQTHSGIFHCDDVLVTAFLEMYCEKNKIKLELERNDTINSNNDIFFDVGYKYDPSKGYFDHHQEDENIMHEVKKANGELVKEKRSSFGLIWQNFGEEFLKGRANWVFDTQFVSQVDHFDNYGGNFFFGRTIKEFNHVSADSTVELQFKKAVEYAKVTLNTYFISLKETHEEMELVFEKAKNKEVKKSGVFVADEYISGMNSALGSKCPWISFFIAPSGRGEGAYNLFPIYIDKVATPKIPIIKTQKMVYYTDRFAQFKSIEDAIECIKISKRIHYKGLKEYLS